MNLLRMTAWAILLHDRYLNWLINSPSALIPGTNRSIKAERTLYPFVGSLSVFLLSVGFPSVFGGVWVTVLVTVLSGVALVITGYFFIAVARDIYKKPKG